MSPENPVPENIPKPHYYYKLNKPSGFKLEPEIKSSEEIIGMRESCKLAANILHKCQNIVQVRILHPVFM